MLLQLFFAIAFIITMLIALYLGLKKKDVELPQIKEQPKPPSKIVSEKNDNQQ